jgi:hypothetical protein
VRTTLLLAFISRSNTPTRTCHRQFLTRNLDSGLRIRETHRLQAAVAISADEKESIISGVCSIVREACVACRMSGVAVKDGRVHRLRRPSRIEVLA